MDYQTFTWGRSGNRSHKTERWVDRVWILGLLLAALLLFGINLGSPPLLEGSEGTVALAAREITKLPLEVGQWLHSTLTSKPDFAAPPLLHFLIAGIYKIGGFNEWTTRLPSAILSALAVPLLYGIGREIFPSRKSALFSSLIYLTFLPVVCSGRLASVDGVTLCFVVLVMWSVLRSRRDFRWSLGIGMGLGLIGLSKGLILTLLLLGIVLTFLAWDTPRLLTSLYWWLGLLLGGVPSLSWCTAWLLSNPETFISKGLFYASLGSFWSPVGVTRNLLWYYLTQLLKFLVPWVLFWPYGLRLAWENRVWSWAKLVLVWSGAYSLAILVLVNQLPGYVLPVYPALALAGGAYLAEVWSLPTGQSYPRVWIIGLFAIGLGAIAGSIASTILPLPDRSLSVIFASVALTTIIAAILVARRELQFIFILLWGTYISLLLFMTSPYWIWELETAYPVREVATILKRGTPEHQTIYTSLPGERPALKFYSDRSIVPTSNELLKRHWVNDKEPYLLLDSKTHDKLNLTLVREIAKTKDSNWVVITKKPKPK